MGDRLFEDQYSCEARKKGELKPLHDDPFHAASAVIGATVFYVAALAPLAPSTTFKAALTPEQIAAHKEDVLRTMCLLLGISSTPRRAAKKPARRKKRSRSALRFGRSGKQLTEIIVRLPQ